MSQQATGAAMTAAPRSASFLCFLRALVIRVLPGARVGDVSVALLVVALVGSLGATVGYRTFTPEPVPVGEALAFETTGFLQTLAGIAAQNLGAALLGFSGVLTMGMTSLLAVMFTSAWVGATFHAVTARLGTAEVLAHVMPYVVLELAGVGLAAVAGVYPAVAFVARRFRSDPRPPFGSAMQTSLRLLGIACVLIVAGAFVETVVIVTTHP